MRESATRNTPLPNSVEKAYHQKCIDLKRRLREIEGANDAARLRKHRIERAVAKMRIERAFLLDHLARSQHSTADESDKSTTPPPTPQDRPPRIKRTYQRRSLPPNEQSSSFQSPPPLLPDASQQASTHQIDQSTNLPFIHDLPSGTSVVIVHGQPKLPPWTIRDLDPRHLVSTHFDTLSLSDQEDELYLRDYLPYDMYGNAVAIYYDNHLGKYRHVFPGDPDYVNPVENGERKDAEYNRRRGEEIRRAEHETLGEVTQRSDNASSGGPPRNRMSQSPGMQDSSGVYHRAGP